MTPDAELSMILAALEQRGVEIRVEPCDSDGGLARIKDRQILFLNAASPVDRRIEVALSALKRIGGHEHFLSPHLRSRLQGDEWHE